MAAWEWLQEMEQKEWMASVNSIYYENEFHYFTPDQNWAWKLRYPGPKRSMRTQTTVLVQSLDGHLVGAGSIPRTTIPSAPGGATYGWMAKMSLEGDSVWTRRYSGVESSAWVNEVYDLKNTPDGGFIIVGQSLDDEYPWEPRIYTSGYN